MKRIFIPLALLSGAFAHSQVGIGTPEPDTSAELDITSTDKGILIPRVALQDLTDTTTITNGNVNSLIVFNTNETTDLQPGYYYWYNDRWLRMINQNDSSIKEPWKIQNTENQAVLNTDDIYQQGKVAVGFTKDDEVSNKQFEVKGNIKVLEQKEGGLFNWLESGVDTSSIGVDPEKNLINVFGSFDDTTLSNVFNLSADGSALFTEATKKDEVAGVDELFGAILRSTSGKGRNRAEVRSQVGEDLSSALVALVAEDSTDEDISSIEVHSKEILLGNFYGGSFNNRISLGKEEGVRFSFNDLESYTFPRNSGNENQVLTVSDSNSHTNLIWKDVDDLMSQPWRIQNTTNKATLNTDDIYQQGKVAVGFTKDDEVSDKQLEVKGSIKVVDPGISPYYSLLETKPNLVAEEFDINTPGATSIFGTFDSSNETGTRFEGKNGAGVFARLVKDPVMGRVYTHTTTTKIQSSDTYSLNRFMLSTSSDASHFELSTGNGANSNTEQSYASILGDSYMGRLSFNTEGSTDGSGMYIVKNRGIVFYNGINSAEESYVFPRNKGTKNQILTVGDPVDVPEALNNIPANALVWKDAGDLMSQPWKIQNTENTATLNSDNIYQQGNVAIGTISDDLLKDEKLYVIGNTKFETGYVNALSPNNEQSSSIYTFPNAVYIESNAKNNGVNDGRSYIMNSAGQDLSSQGLLPEVWMSASSDNVDGKAYGDYAIRSSVKEKNSGFGIHNFTAASDISGSLQNTFVGIDDEGLKIGEIKLGTGSSYDNHWGFNGSMVADTYYLPKELPTQGQVLTYGSATSQGGKNTVKTKWESMENLTAGPKYFHAPSIVLPVVSTELSSGMSYDAGSGEFTVNLHTIYANQFGMAGDVNGVSRTALRSNQNDTLPVHTATELSYFITYFDNIVFDPQNISLSNDGILKYKVLTTDITERTYMNIVFKVK